MKDPTKVLRVTGDLYLNPTDLVSNFGTPLGIYDQLIIRPNRNVIVYDEVEGSRVGQPKEIVQAGESWEVGVSLREWKDDTVRLVFPEAVSGPKITSIPSTGRLSGNVLYFRPVDSSHPSLILYNGVGVMAEESEMVLAAIEELVLECVFYALPDASGRVREFGIGISL